WQQLNRGDGQGKVHEVGGHELLVHAADDVVHANLDRICRRRADFGHFRVATRRELDIISRLRPGCYEPFAWQVLVGVERRAYADALLLAQRPYGQQLVADLEDVVINERLYPLGYFDVFVVGLFEGGHGREIDMVKDREFETVLNCWPS